MKIRLLVDPPENVFVDQMIGNIVLAFQRKGYQIARAQAYLLWLQAEKPFVTEGDDIDAVFNGMWAEKDEDEFA